MQVKIFFACSRVCAYYMMWYENVWEGDLRANVCKCVYMRDGMLQDFYPRMLISMHRKMISRV